MDSVLVYNNLVGNVEGKVWKYPFSRTTLSFGAPVYRKPCEYSHKCYTLGTTLIHLHFRRWLCECVRLSSFVFRGGLVSRMCGVKQPVLLSRAWDSRKRTRTRTMSLKLVLEDKFSSPSPCPCPRTTSPCPGPRKFKSSEIFEDWVGYLCQHFVLG